MKLVPSAIYTAFLKAAFKQLRYRMFVRVTEDVSLSIVGYSGWTEITHRVVEVPKVENKIEFDVGQFASQGISLVLKNIAWFNTYVLDTVSDGQEIEIKVEVQLGQNDVYASDVVYLFAGYVDQHSILPSNNDTIKCTMYSHDELGNRIAAELLTEQNTITLPNTQTGLIVGELTNIFVVNASMPGFRLDYGEHTIQYKATNGGYTLSFKGGRETPIVFNVPLVLGDGKEAAKDTARITVFIPLDAPMRDAFHIADTLEVEDHIVVLHPEDILPRTWYRHIYVNNLLSFVADTLDCGYEPQGTIGQIPTFDNQAHGQFLSNPPCGVLRGNRNTTCLRRDASTVWVGVRNHVYIYDLTTYVWTRLLTLPEQSYGVNIEKLLYNARNDHLWIVYWDGVVYRVRRYTISTEVFSSERGFEGLRSYQSIDLLDYLYTGSSYKYCLIYIASFGNGESGSINAIDGTSLVSTAIVQQSDLTSGDVLQAFQKCLFIHTNGSIYWSTYSHTPVLYGQLATNVAEHTTGNTTNYQAFIGPTIQPAAGTYTWVHVSVTALSTGILNPHPYVVVQGSMNGVDWFDITVDLPGGSTLAPITILGIQESERPLSNAEAWIYYRYKLFLWQVFDTRQSVTFSAQIRTTVPGAFFTLWKFHVNTSGTWVNDGRVFDTPGLLQYDRATFNTVNERVYFAEVVPYTFISQIYSHSLTNRVPQSHNIEVHNTYYNQSIVNGIRYVSEIDKVVVSVYNQEFFPDVGETSKLWTISGVADGVQVDDHVLFNGNAVAYVDGRMVGVASQPEGRLEYALNTPSLWDMDTVKKVIVPYARISEDQVVRDILLRVVKLYMVFTCTPHKKLKVWKRLTAANTLSNSGDIHRLGADEMSAAVARSGVIQRAPVVELSNKTTRLKYDGVSFFANTPTRVALAKISDDWISSEYLKDLLKQIWEFLGKNYSTYTVPMAQYPAFHVDTQDGVELSLQSYLQVPFSTGTIYNARYLADGSVELDVMVQEE